MAFDPAFIQFGFTTANLDMAIDHFARTAGISEFLLWPATPVEMVRDGETRHAVLDLAFGWRGSTMIEIIQPVSGAIDVYSLRGSEDAPVLPHHIGHGVPGKEFEFDARLDAAVANGFPVTLVTRAHVGNYALVDTRQVTGLYTEYLWSGTEGAALFDSLPQN